MFICFAFCAVLALASAPALLATDQKRPSNVLVILADDLGYGDKTSSPM